MRTVYVWDPETQSVIIKNRAQRVRATAVISDVLHDVQHPHTLKYYDSKKAFRDENKRLGLIEVGNESAALVRMAEEGRAARSAREAETLQSAVREAINMVEGGYRPPPVDRMRGDRVI